MKFNISLYTACSLIFLMILMLSGGFSGATSEIIYIFAFVLAMLAGLKLARPKPPSEAGEVYQLTPVGYLNFSKKAAKLTAPLIFPAVGAITLLSFLTSLIMTAIVGPQSLADVGDNLFIAVIMHALIPALLEEGVFRLLPMYLLSGYSRRVAIGLSAVYFALVHNSLFAIPYAFFAGIIFIAVDLAADSVWPSVIIHFVNNFVSILWMFYSAGTGFVIGFSVSLGVLSLLSIGYILLRRKEYVSDFAGLFVRDEKYTPSYEPLMMIIPSLILAVASLF